MADGSAYWPWWAGALGLAAAALSHLFLLRRPMGVSSVYARLLALREERQRDAEEQRVFSDAALRRSLIAETVADMRAAGVDEAEIAKLEQQALQAAPAGATRLPVDAQLVFVVCVLIGAVLSALISGRITLQWLPGGLHTSFFGSGAGLGFALLGGGLLVGLGTRLAGGCTSGHGLSGCARLQPASFVATALFFGVGVAVSLALGVVLR